MNMPLYKSVRMLYNTYMKRSLISICALFATMMTASTLNAEMLLWMLDEPLVHDVGGKDVPLGELVGRGEAEGLAPNFVRLTKTDSNGDVVFLNLSDSSDMAFYDWLAIPDAWDDWKAGPAWADIGDYSYDALFTLQVGYGELDEEGNFLKWLVLASGSDSYEHLASYGHVFSNELSYQSGFEWKPYLSVPEPSSMMLVLIGLSFLGLKRKVYLKYN